MESASLPEPEPLRRSTRNFVKVEDEDKNSKYEPDSFSDPRKRIRNPELLERLNDFLWDVGTDPDQIDVNFPDLSKSSNQARVFYVPRLDDDNEQSIVPENDETDLEVNVQADLKRELESPEMIFTPASDQNDFGESTEVIDVYVPVPKRDIEQSSVLDNEEISVERHVQVDVKPELAPPERILAATNERNGGNVDFDASVESIKVENIKVEIEDDRNERQISKKPKGPRGRNILSNCVTT